MERFGNRERLDGIAIYDAMGRPIFVTPSLAARLGIQPPSLDPTVFEGGAWSHFFGSGATASHLSRWC